MMLFQKTTTFRRVGGISSRPPAGLAPLRRVVVRYTDDKQTERSWRDSPYYADTRDDPAESLRNGYEKLKAKWDDWKPEKRNQTLAWGGGGLLVLYLANGLLNQIDRLPLLPSFLQLVGLAFSSWFAFRYLLYAEGREDLSRLSLDTLLGRAGEEATADFSRAFGEGGEGIADAGNRIRKSEAGRDIKSAFNDGGSRLSDGSSGGYTGREVKSNIKGALRDIDDVADDVAGR